MNCPSGGPLPASSIDAGPGRGPAARRPQGLSARADGVSRCRRPLRAAAVLIAAAACALQAQGGLEYDVKAAFLYNIIQFVEWPARPLSDPSVPFRLCLYVENPFGPSLEDVMRGEQIDGRPIVVERLPAGSSSEQCQLLFVPQSQDGRTAAALRGAAMGSVLLVGESPGFLERGGMINFFVEGGRVRFDVNQTAASARGLTISSRLLRVARNTAAIAGDR